MSAANPPSWEIRREVRPGSCLTYAHGSWRPLIVVILGHVVYGRRALRRAWEGAER